MSDKKKRIGQKISNEKKTAGSKAISADKSDTNKKVASRDSEKSRKFINRELSWLKFNERCLEESRNNANPLFERLKFLSITASNLDEFVMVRVASLYDMIDSHVHTRDIAGLSPKEQLAAVTAELHDFVKAQYTVFNRSLLPLLEEENVVLIGNRRDLTEDDALFLKHYFEDEVYPVLTPMAVDASRPFPLVANRALYIGALVKKKSGEEDIDLCMVQVPQGLPRLIELPDDGTGKRRFTLLEQVIEQHLENLFINYEILCRHVFRILRSADFSIDEDEAPDLLQEIETQLKKRRWGRALRLELPKGADKRLVRRLATELKVEDNHIYRLDAPPDLTFLMSLYGQEGFERLKEKGYRSNYPPEGFEEEDDLFEVIRNGDVLLHHPYESFVPVVRFVEAAARDPQVLAIKQTLYRVSGNSPIIAALARAADAGKQVSVLVELKARFDEENNIGWAKMLEKAGCHVIYGLVGLKTHCKITLVVRREEDGIRRYVHLGTGNYNDSTARLYTDVGLFTCKESYGADATAVFNMLSGYSEPPVWNKLVLAPLWLKDRILYLIRREEETAARGEPAHIIAKMNSLCHPEVIEALYAAAAKGVYVDLIVRGICSLRTDVKECAGRITVRSIVGNFLEHSRIFYFENGYQPEVYCSSADWMPRNLERRVEIMFPVEDENLVAKLRHVLDLELADTEKARLMKEDGVYLPVDKRGKQRVNSQQVFCDEAAGKDRGKRTGTTRVFRPRTSADKEED